MGPRTYVLSFMLYAAYPRTIADVSVQTANVLAWRGVTAISNQNLYQKVANLLYLMTMEYYYIASV